MAAAAAVGVAQAPWPLWRRARDGQAQTVGGMGFVGKMSAVSRCEVGPDVPEQFDLH